MAANSKIEWCDHTFNPWIGCTKVSPGCANCYAESENNRRLWATQGWGPGKPRHRTSAANWNKVRVWNEQAKGAAQRPRVFSASLADWLDDEVPITWLAELLLLIRDTPNLDWLLLTKRPQNFHFRMEEILNSDLSGAATSPASVRRPSRLMEIYNPDLSEALRDLPREWLDGRPPKNVWFGVSTEDQKRADSRIPFLFSIPAFTCLCHRSGRPTPSSVLRRGQAQGYVGFRLRPLPKIPKSWRPRSASRRAAGCSARPRKIRIRWRGARVRGRCRANRRARASRPDRSRRR